MVSFCRKLKYIENAFIAVTLAVTAIACFAQVVNRNLIGAPVSWFDELARYCMVCMTLFAAEAGLRDGSQIAVTALIDKVSPANRRRLLIFSKLVIVAFSISVVCGAFILINSQIRSGQTSPGLHLPMYVPYSFVPLVFAVIAVVQGTLFFRLLKCSPEKLDELLKREKKGDN
ncbi:MAG: TRAP transporter small permease [Succinatimonas hippei]|nr:TRAP transporter small permease [Succinatimonas hippei]